MRSFNFIETALCGVDTALRTLVPPPHRHAQRTNPSQLFPEATLTNREKKHIAGLVRVNHAGEVCAQALYQGQALTAKSSAVQAQLSKAAAEEVDHLAWCEDRLRELDSHTSLLNPLWYGGSFLLGALSGLAGDSISLGFVAETENQVTRHLQKHIQQLPVLDKKTHAILKKMQDDEMQHAEMAHRAGGKILPYVIQQSMRVVSTLLTKGSYYI